jgi:nicotinamidase-related amidase
MALQTRYDEIVEVGKIATVGGHRHPGEILKLAPREQLRPAVDDAKRVLLVIIDMQNDFMEGGSLAVPGAQADVERLTRWMYEQMEGVTSVMCSIDTHYPLQIFHPAMWADAAGNPPADYTMITYDDVQQGKWKVANGNPKKALECLKALAQSGKVGVMVWPYHCLIGSDGWKLEQELDNMIHFHSAVRRTKPQLVFKGTDTYSEMYGVIEPEYNPEGFVNYAVLNAIAEIDAQGELEVNYDEIYLAGEAASHCLLESGEQILRHFKNHPEVTQRITILEDCTSPIPGCEQATLDAFDEFKRSYGIQVKKSIDVQLV